MDGSQPVRITQDGDHQVVHLPSGVAAPADAVVRQDGERLIIERAGLRMGSSARLLARLATMEPIDEELGEIDDPPPGPVNLRSSIFSIPTSSPTF